MTTLTDGERKVISLAWQSFKSVPEVDYKKLQQLGGYKTAASATSCYLAARKKMLSCTANVSTGANGNGNTTPAKLTEGENKVLFLAWQCFKEMPQVDYKRLAQLGSYKTPASATSCYLAARKKVLTPNLTTNTTTDKTPTPASRKRKAGPSDGEAPSPTSSKARRVKKLKRDPVKLEENDGTDVNDDIKSEAKVVDSAAAVEVEVNGEEAAEMEHLFSTAKEFLDREGSGEEVHGGKVESDGMQEQQQEEA